MGDRLKKECILEVCTSNRQKLSNTPLHVLSPFWDQESLYQRQRLYDFWEPTLRKLHLTEEDITQFKSRLCNRGYPGYLLDKTLSEVKSSERVSALGYKINKNENKHLSFSTFIGLLFMFFSIHGATRLRDCFHLWKVSLVHSWSRKTLKYLAYLPVKSVKGETTWCDLQTLSIFLGLRYHDLVAYTFK